MTHFRAEAGGCQSANVSDSLAAHRLCSLSRQLYGLLGEPPILDLLAGISIEERRSKKGLASEEIEDVGLSLEQNKPWSTYADQGL